MNVLVTGSSGFIGRHLIPELVEADFSVAGLDPVDGGPDERYRTIKGSILEDDKVAATMAVADRVIHLAAEHRDFGVSDQDFHRVNVEGTSRLLEAAGAHDVRDFVFFSSVAVYGPTRVPSHEDLAPAPEATYGETKLQAEKLVEQWAAAHPLRRALIIRPTVIFGPHNYANMFRLIAQISRRRYLQIGAGDNVKSVGYVENIAAATMFLMRRMKPGVDVYNFADHPHLTSRQIATTICEALEVNVPRLVIPESFARAIALPLDAFAAATGRDVPITSKRIAKFNTTTHHSARKLADTGFEARYTTTDGLRKMVDWFVQAGQLTA